MSRSLTAAVTAAAILAVPVPATRSEQWRAIAVDAFTRFEQATVPAGSRASVFSQALVTAGRLYGWDDPRVAGYLAKLMAVRNPDGGWGIGYAWDAFQDGSVNPATTTYTVTLAGDVGPALLEAWHRGALTDPEPLTTITRLLVSDTPRTTTTAGVCVGYSRAGVDNKCVPNVSAGVGAYLWQARAAGFDGPGLMRLVADITRRTVATYNVGWSGWPYIEGQAAKQDPDHGAYTAASMYLLAYPIGRQAVFNAITTPATTDQGRRGHLRSVSVPGGAGSQGADPATTLWCELGDQWLGEAAAYVTAAASRPNDLVSAAAGASANAQACRED